MSAVANEPTRAELDLAREAFDRTGVGLVVITAEGVFRTVNRAFCEMIGYSAEELEGQSFRRVTHPDDVARDEDLLRQIRSGLDPQGAVDKRFVRKGGGEVWARRSATVVRDPNGQARFIVGAFIDLTLQRSGELALQQQMHFTRALLDAIPNPVYFKDPQGRSASTTARSRSSSAADATGSARPRTTCSRRASRATTTSATGRSSSARRRRPTSC